MLTKNGAKFKHKQNKIENMQYKSNNSPDSPETSTSAGEISDLIRLTILLFAIFCASLLSQIDRILPFIMAESIKKELSLSDTQVGLLTGLAFALCYSLFSLPLARAADRLSPRLVLICCILLWSAMTTLGAIATSFAWLALSRFGVAFGEAGGTPAAHAIIARKIDKRHQGLAIGLFAMGIPLGTMVGFALGGMMTDAIGWRSMLLVAGLTGMLVAALVYLAVGPTPPRMHVIGTTEPFIPASIKLLASPRFRWLFIGAAASSLAAAPFYAFATTFLIRSFGFTVSEAGLTFGLMQGCLGIMGTLVGGRVFDRTAGLGGRLLLAPPAILFLVASVTTTIALFVPLGWVSVLFLIPAMLSFSFMLPFGFGAAHLVAGKGNEALASGLLMLGSGLLGPALGPLLVGVISDAMTAAGVVNGLAYSLLIVPLASIATGAAMLVASRMMLPLPAHTGGPHPRCSCTTDNQ
jgi:predicted MFS family arabinose efflux permease